MPGGFLVLLVKDQRGRFLWSELPQLNHGNRRRGESDVYLRQFACVSVNVWICKSPLSVTKKDVNKATNTVRNTGSIKNNSVFFFDFFIFLYSFKLITLSFLCKINRLRIFIHLPL